MFTNVVKRSLCAAHKIDGHLGKCSRLHGHNWTVDIVVEAYNLNSLGIAIDFTEIKSISEPLMKELDHSYLNEIPYFQKESPTSENLARYIYDNLCESFRKKDVFLKKIVVWETPKCYSSYRKVQKN